MKPHIHIHVSRRSKDATKPISKRDMEKLASWKTDKAGAEAWLQSMGLTPGSTDFIGWMNVFRQAARRSGYSIDALITRVGNFLYKYEDGVYWVKEPRGERQGSGFIEPKWRELSNPPRDVVQAISKAYGHKDAEGDPYAAGLEQARSTEEKLRRQFPVGTWVRENRMGAPRVQVRGHQGSMLVVGNNELLHGTKAVKDASNLDYVWNIAAMFAKEGKNEAYLRAYLSKMTTKKLTKADIDYAVQVLAERSQIEQINRRNGYDAKDAELLAPGDKVISRSGRVVVIEAKRKIYGEEHYKIQGEWVPASQTGSSSERDKPWRRYLGDALRLVHTETAGSNQVKVYYNPDVEEFVAKLYVGGKYQEPADYFTNEKSDAIATAKQMAAKGVVSDADVSLQELKRHNLWSEGDYQYLKAKGYSNAEILMLWKRDWAQGRREPQQHTNKPWQKDASEGEYGVRYRQAVGRSGSIQVKEKFFPTQAALDKFVEKIAQADGFIEFTAWLSPTTKDYKVGRAIVHVHTGDDTVVETYRKVKILRRKDGFWVQPEGWNPAGPHATIQEARKDVDMWIEQEKRKRVGGDSAVKVGRHVVHFHSDATSLEQITAQVRRIVRANDIPAAKPLLRTIELQLKADKGGADAKALDDLRLQLLELIQER